MLIQFDPSQVSYADLVDRFWKVHDSTRRNPDGGQYRNAIFPRNDEQMRVALDSKACLEASRRSSHPVTTRIEPAGIFWRAEERHQRYYEKHGLR